MNIVVFSTEVPFSVIENKAPGVTVVLGQENNKKLTMYKLPTEDFKDVRHFVESYLHIIEDKVYLKTTEDKSCVLKGVLRRLDFPDGIINDKYLLFTDTGDFYTVLTKQGH